MLNSWGMGPVFNDEERMTMSDTVYQTTYGTLFMYVHAVDLYYRVITCLCPQDLGTSRYLYSYCIACTCTCVHTQTNIMIQIIYIVTVTQILLLIQTMTTPSRELHRARGHQPTNPDVRLVLATLHTITTSNGPRI